MTRKIAAILGITIGTIIGASAVCLWHFNKPVTPQVLIQVEEA